MVKDLMYTGGLDIPVSPRVLFLIVEELENAKRVVESKETTKTEKTLAKRIVADSEAVFSHVAIGDA